LEHCKLVFKSKGPFFFPLHHCAFVELTTAAVLLAWRASVTEVHTYAPGHFHFHDLNLWFCSAKQFQSTVFDLAP
jgi:hypothetical protein